MFETTTNLNMVEETVNAIANSAASGRSTRGAIRAVHAPLAAVRRPRLSISKINSYSANTQT